MTIVLESSKNIMKVSTVNRVKELPIIIDNTWDYNGVNTKQYTHCFHTYPAMFIPQVARRLLKEYSSEKDTICDIFCGSGTALVESRLLGRNCYGIELNPLAVLITRAKTRVLNPSHLQEQYFSILDHIKRFKIDDVDIPKFFNIDFWFKENVINDLAKIKESILGIANEPEREFFLVAFSEAARLASNMRRGEFKLYRIPEEKLNDYQPDTTAIFRKICERNIIGIRQFNVEAKNDVWIKVMHADTTKPYDVPGESVDCIITSPPYGDSRTTVAYGQFSRLSAQWLGVEDEDNRIDTRLLGGKINRNGKINFNSEH